MDINLVLDVCNEIDASNGIGFIKDVVNRLGKMPWDTAKKFLRQKAKEFEAFVKGDPYVDDRNVLRIINNRFGTHFTDVHSVFAKGIVENTEKCDEGLKDWWKEASSSLYGALSFYPLLTAFLELDKIIKGTGDANTRVMAVYFLIWTLIVSGKVIAGKIAGPGAEKEAGAVINPKSWAEIANRARVNASTNPVELSKIDENAITDVIGYIKGVNFDEAWKKILKSIENVSNFDEIDEIIKIINKNFKINVKSLKNIPKKPIFEASNNLEMVKKVVSDPLFVKTAFDVIDIMKNSKKENVKKDIIMTLIGVAIMFLKR